MRDLQQSGLPLYPSQGMTVDLLQGEIEFKVHLSKVQLFGLKKAITEEENIFTEDIEGKCLDIDL